MSDVPLHCASLKDQREKTCDEVTGIREYRAASDDYHVGDETKEASNPLGRYV